MDGDELSQLDDDIVSLPKSVNHQRFVAALLQVLGCLSVAIAGFLFSTVVGFVVVGISLLVLGIALERTT